MATQSKPHHDVAVTPGVMPDGGGVKTVRYFECLQRVRRNGCALEDVPVRFKTPKMCLVAVGENGFALRYVPEGLITPEMCFAAVEEDGYALEYVPADMMTIELCLIAVGQNGYAFQYVPDSIMHNSDVCEMAVQQNMNVFMFLPAVMEVVCGGRISQDDRGAEQVPMGAIPWKDVYRTLNEYCNAHDYMHLGNSVRNTLERLERLDEQEKQSMPKHVLTIVKQIADMCYKPSSKRRCPAGGVKQRFGTRFPPVLADLAVKCLPHTMQ